MVQYLYMKKYNEEKVEYITKAVQGVVAIAFLILLAVILIG